MRRAWVALLLSLSLLALTPSSPATATTQTTLVWSSATGNLSLALQSDGANGVAMTQNLQTFRGSATMNACENTFNSATGLTFPGGWSVQVSVVGKRALATPSALLTNQWAYYANDCSWGYNQSASIMVQADFSVHMQGSGNGIGGSMRLGLATLLSSPSTQGPCGPFLDVKFGTTGSVTGMGLGITTGQTPSSATWYSPVTAVNLANATWYRAYLWSNNSALKGQIGTNTVSATHAWTSLACYVGQAEEQQINGAIVYLNQTAPSGFPGAAWQFGTNNVTIGSNQRFGATLYKSTGYATSLSTPSTTSIKTFAFTYLSPTHFREHDAGPNHVYETGPTNYLCPCYVNSSAGVKLWNTTTPIALPSGYTARSYNLNVTSIPPGISFTLAFRFNSTDGLATSYVSSVSLPLPTQWVNPGQGTESGVVTQAAGWIGPMVAVMLCGVLFFSVFEAYRRKFSG